MDSRRLGDKGAPGQYGSRVLHPYTNAMSRQANKGVCIERGDGIYVYDKRGKRYLEGLSGLWNVALGFNNERLMRAASRQLEVLPYYHTFNGKRNDTSERLAEELVAITPGRLEHVFFANSGSEANDSAVKLVWFYNNVLGRRERKKIISRKNGYHGVTVAAASLTGLQRNHDGFDLPLGRFFHTGCPCYYRYGSDGESEAEFVERLADELESLILDEGPETVAAFFGEPVMGAGGVIVPPSMYWKRIQEVCRKYEILVVADEVITGFGRTGRWFGSDRYSIEPDIMVLSKQLTSAYIPLSAVLLSDQVFNVVAKGSNDYGTLGHGFTTSGHPVAAAVAIENIDIIKSERLVEKSEKLGDMMREALLGINSNIIGEVRGVGLLAGVELLKDGRSKVGSMGAEFAEVAEHNGLILRNMEDTIALCPPLVISEKELYNMIDIFAESLHTIEKNAALGGYR